MVEKTHTHNPKEGSDKSHCLGCWAENIVPVLKEADRFLMAHSSPNYTEAILKIRQALFDFER